MKMHMRKIVLMIIGTALIVFAVLGGIRGIFSSTYSYSGRVSFETESEYGVFKGVLLSEAVNLLPRDISVIDSGYPKVVILSALQANKSVYFPYGERVPDRDNIIGAVAAGFIGLTLCLAGLVSAALNTAPEER